MELDVKQYFKTILETPPVELKQYFGNFHNYSPFNIWLLWIQDVKSPVNTFKKWKEMGYDVKKGAKAKTISIPVRYKDKETEKDKLFFLYKKCLFSLEDVTGEEFKLKEFEYKFDKDKLLTNLEIKEEQFELIKGNILGYAKSTQKIIAISPLCQNKDITLLHEVAHCLLHGKDELEADHTNSIKELEAELTSYICGNVLGISDDEANGFSSTYIKRWYNSNELNEKIIKRVSNAVDKILKALK